jgi:hypothetical protein
MKELQNENCQINKSIHTRMKYLLEYTEYDEDQNKWYHPFSEIEEIVFLMNDYRRQKNSKING